MGVYYQRDDLELLNRAVQSILNQSLPDFEFLICDDGSSPQAVARLDQFARMDQRIKLIRPGGAYSLPVKLNACLKQAKGALIARMDDDDDSHPDRFERQAVYLRTYPEIAFVGCNVTLYRSGNADGIRRLPEFPEIKDFYMTQPFVHPTLMFRREALDTVGGYSEEKSCDHCEDYDLLLRLYAQGYRGANMQEILFDYTAPNAKGNRTMRHRWNECVTRYRRFRQLGVLAVAFPYVIKPIVVGILPSKLTDRLVGVTMMCDKKGK
jgi:glycosyltransferase involved in cell wall biosynthesis